MACFLVPTAEAVVTTVASKAARSKEQKAESAPVHSEEETCEIAKIPFSRKLKWLSNMLWGGSGLLAFEHIWHGELVPWFPFLTNAANPQDAMEMLHEMAVTGSTMALLVTTVWCGMILITGHMQKKAWKDISEKAKEDA